MNFRRRKRFIQFLILCVILFAGFSLHREFKPETLNTPGKQLAGIANSVLSRWSPPPAEIPRVAFFSCVLETIAKHAPIGISARVYGKECPTGDVNVESGAPKFHYLSKENLSKCLQVSNQEIQMLKKSHKNYTHAIRKISLPSNTFFGDGIVTIGGGKYTVLAYQVVKMLRRAGSKLPIEVLMPPENDRDEDFCREIETDGAKCIYFESVFDSKVLDKFAVEGYQLKAIAMLVSSFERILFLDSDNLALKNVDTLFDDPIFNETGFILWPDFWRRKTHPALYEIMGKTVENIPLRRSADDITPPPVYSKEIPLHDLKGAIPDGSTESGQFLFNKSKHFYTILLAMYYNVYGPAWYYPLTTQGTSGEGDKDTFIAAAHYFNLPYYQVKKLPRSDGYFEKDGSYRGICMVQADFRADYQQYLKAKKEISMVKFTEPYKQESFDKYFGNSEVSSLFMHANFPKFDPLQAAVAPNFVDENGNHYRVYRGGPRDMYQFDLEWIVWEYTNDLVCKKAISFGAMSRAEAQGHSRLKICKYINDRIAHMRDTHIQYFPKET